MRGIKDTNLLTVFSNYVDYLFKKYEMACCTGSILFVLSILYMMVVWNYVDQKVNLSPITPKKPMEGFKFENFKLTRLYGKKIKIVDSTEHLNESDYDEKPYTPITKHQVSLVEKDYMAGYFVALYVFFFLPAMLVWGVYGAYFTFRYILSAIGYKYNIYNTFVRPRDVNTYFVELLSEGWNAGVFVLAIFLLTATLYLIYILIKFHKTGVFAVLAVTHVKIATLKLLFKNRFLVYSEIVDSSSPMVFSDGTVMDFKSSDHYIFSWQNLLMVYFILLMWAVLYAATLLSLYPRPVFYKISVFTFKKSFWSRFILANAWFDLFLIVLTLVPELPMFLSCFGYDHVEMLIDYRARYTFDDVETALPTYPRTIVKMHVDQVSMQWFVVVSSLLTSLMHSLISMDLKFCAYTVRWKYVAKHMFRFYFLIKVVINALLLQIISVLALYSAEYIFTESLLSLTWQDGRDILMVFNIYSDIVSHTIVAGFYLIQMMLVTYIVFRIFKYIVKRIVNYFKNRNNRK